MSGAENQISGAATVLAIDGDSSRVQAIREFLEAKGWRVVTAARSDAALELSGQADLIVASLQLPDDGAIELCRKLKSNNQTTHIPVLLVSRASVDDGLVAKLFDAGADDYVEIQQPGELLACKAGRLLELHRVQRVRRLAEEALRESEEQYRLFFEANPEPMWVYDRDTLAILAVNEAAITHYGYSRGEFLEMHITDLRPAEDIPRLIDSIKDSSSGFQARRPWRHRLKDGRIISEEISSNDLMFLGRRARLVLSSDVTERQRAEEALRESEERFAKAFDSNPDPVSIHTLD